MVTREGESDDIILVGAHYDSAGTHGADDNGPDVAVVLEKRLVFAVQRNTYAPFPNWKRTYCPDDKRRLDSCRGSSVPVWGEGEGLFEKRGQGATGG